MIEKENERWDEDSYREAWKKEIAEGKIKLSIETKIALGTADKSRSRRGDDL